MTSDKMTYANSADPDQTAPEEQSDQGLHCLQFHASILNNMCIKKQTLGQNSME